MGQFVDATVSNTAGNATATITPGLSSRRWRIHRLRLKLVADGTGANRYIRVRLVNSNSGGVDQQSAILGVITTAGQTKYLSFQPYSALSSATFSDEAVIGLSQPIVLDKLNQLTITVDNGVAGDVLSGAYSYEYETAV